MASSAKGEILPDSKILNVKDIEFLDSNTHLKLVQMVFIQDGKKKNWDLIRNRDSVSVIVFNKSRKKLLFIKKFILASYLSCLPVKNTKEIDLEKYPPSLGEMIEMCSTVINEEQSEVKNANDEIRRVYGYEVPKSSLQKILSFRTIGESVSRLTIFYVEVSDEMKSSCSEKDDKIIEISVDEAEKYVNSEDVNSSPACLSAIRWFLLNKKIDK